MKKNIKEYLDRFWFSFIGYIFRKTTLNYILFTLIILTIAQAGAIAKNQPLSAFVQELKHKFPEGPYYIILRIIEIFFVQGSWLVLIVCLFLTLLVASLKKTEISKAYSGVETRLIKEGLEKKLEIANKSLKSIQSEAEREENEKLEYRRLLNKINFTLQEKNISKEEILFKFNKKLRVLIIHKNMEDTSLYEIRDQFYPHIGAFHIHGGTCIVPPNKINQDLTDRQILEWFETELHKFVPADYCVNFSIISVVDLKNVSSIQQNMHPKSRYRKTYLDGLNIDQIFTLREIESFFYSEKNISSRDIIDVPSLPFLIDRDLISHMNFELVVNKNNEIIESLKKKVGVKDIKTTDIARINPKHLAEALDDFGANADGVVDNIIENANFWSDYFDRKI